MISPPYVNEAGIYLVRLYVNGVMTPVIVDDHLPSSRSGLSFMNSSAAELWPSLIEKAWARLHGTYSRIETALPQFISDQTVIGSRPWSALKNEAMKDGYQKLYWHYQISDEERRVLESLRKEQSHQQDMKELRVQHDNCILSHLLGVSSETVIHDQVEDFDAYWQELKNKLKRYFTLMSTSRLAGFHSYQLLKMLHIRNEEGESIRMVRM